MDKSKKLGGKRPFFMHVMTTSNHRPYTYPAGRIDIPSGTGRSGAVKYTDHAIGDFLRRAKTHAWFDDTVFVITADHGASARGTQQIPLARYRIPLMIYSPKHVTPGRFERLMSQIDIAPTILGLMNMGYSSKFYGHDVFQAPPNTDRALVGNYQTLGYMKDGRLVTLMPGRKVAITDLPAELGLPKPRGVADERLREEAISLYQSASALYNGGLQGDEEMNRTPPLRPIRASYQPPRKAP
jgi:phosphoglycerol transferase MdoB-like AlkP superfamily enzyme